MKIFAAIAAAIAIAATILYYSSTTGSFQLNQEIVTTRLSAVLQQKLRRRVTFDRIYYSRFEGVVVRNLRIAKRLGPGYLLTAKRLTLRVDREALSGGKLVVTGMLIDDPVISLTRGEKGPWNFWDLGIEQKTEKSPFFEWKAKTYSISGASVTVDDRKTGMTADIGNLNATIKVLSAYTFTAEAAGSLRYGRPDLSIAAQTKITASIDTSSGTAVSYLAMLTDTDGGYFGIKHFSAQGKILAPKGGTLKMPEASVEMRGIRLNTCKETTVCAKWVDNTALFIDNLRYINGLNKLKPATLEFDAARAEYKLGDGKLDLEDLLVSGDNASFDMTGELDAKEKTTSLKLQAKLLDHINVFTASGPLSGPKIRPELSSSAASAADAFFVQLNLLADKLAAY